MKLPSFEEFAEATDKDEMTEVVYQNIREKLKEAQIEPTENEATLLATAIECALSNTVTLLAAYLRHRLKVVEAQIRGLKSTDGANPELLSRAEADAAYYKEEIGKLQDDTDSVLEREQP